MNLRYSSVIVLLGFTILAPMRSLRAQIDEWRQQPLYGGSVQALAVAGGVLLAGTMYNGIYRTTDNGKHWTQSNLGFILSAVNTLAVTPNGDIFAGTTVGIFLSKDRGITWDRIFTGLRTPVCFCIYCVGNDIYAGEQYDGILRSTDGGKTWKNIGLEKHSVHAIVAMRGGVLLAGTAGEGIFRSTDGGKTWDRSAGDISNGVVNALIADSRGGAIAATFDGGIFHSTDGGITWQRLFTRTISVLSLARDSAGNFLAGTATGGVLRSEDGGNSWTLLAEGIVNGRFNAILCRKDGAMYAGTNNGVYVSSEKEKTNN